MVGEEGSPKFWIAQKSSFLYQNICDAIKANHRSDTNILFLFILKISFIHSRDTERQREKEAPRGEPDAGLNPTTLGSRPEPKA